MTLSDLGNSAGRPVDQPDGADGGADAPTGQPPAAGVSVTAGSAITASATAVSATGGQKPGHGSPSEAKKAVALVLALTAGLSLILALFVSIAVNSGPNGVRLAVAGPAPAVEQIRAGLAQAGGTEAFEVTVVADEAAATAALLDRSVDGAIVVGPQGPMVLTASAGSPAITQLLTTAAGHLANPTATGPPVTDVVPLPADDARGVGLAAGSFPMIIAGLALGVAAALALRSRWIVLGAVVGGAVVIATSFAGILAWLGVSGGQFWAATAAMTMTIATSALVVAGLVRVLGAAGAGLGALLLVIIGNPLSGIATSPRLLPGPWGEFGQWLPTGAGGTLVRTATYFPEASIAWPLTVLLIWAVLGAAGVIWGRAKVGHQEPTTVAATA